MRAAVVSIRFGALAAISSVLACHAFLEFDSDTRAPPEAMGTDASSPVVASRDGAVDAPIGLGPSGAVDEAFGDDGIVEIEESSASAIVVMEDGRLVIAGATAVGGGGVVVRLTPTGSLDEGFGYKGIVKRGDATFTCAALLADGNLLLGGRFRSGATLTASVFRLTANGAFDPAFGTGSTALGYGETVTGLLLESGGSFVTTTDKPDVLQVTRFTETGAIDSTFAEPPKSLTGTGSAGPITAGAGGKVLVGGHDDDALLAVTFAGGIEAETVLVGTALSGMTVSGITVDTSQRVLLSATGLTASSEQRAAVVRLLSTGALDPQFADGGVFEAPGALLAGTVVDGQGRLLLLIGGRIVRLTPNGAIDTTFGQGGYVTLAGSTSHPVRGHALALQPDGRIVAAGYVATQPATMFVARFLP